MVGGFYRMVRWFLDIFLVEKTFFEPKFTELFIDQTKHYKKEIENCSLDGIFVALKYTKEFKHHLENFKYRHNKKENKVFTPYLDRIYKKY